VAESGAEPGSHGASGVETDGRRARRAANRQAAVAALVELYREGRFTPTAAEIAERAGLSARSLFRYFEDYDDLSEAAIAHQQALARPLLGVDADRSDPTEVKIDALARSRAAQFEVLAPAARAARAAAHRRPAVAAGLTQARTFRREQIRRLFAPELAAMTRQEAARRLAVADALCSFESYELLRHDQEMSQAEATATLVQGLGDVFGTSGRGSGH
jgi:AcrR family transcriptional regulator